jgi:anti-sigma B factor antagonist
MATHEGPDGQLWGFEMTVVGTPDPGQVCMRLKGELDIAAVPSARDRIAELKGEGRELVLDLRGLSFIDSSGLNLLLQEAAESTRDGWNLSVIPGPSVVQRIFQLTGTEERLPFRSPRGNGRRLERVG